MPYAIAISVYFPTKPALATVGYQPEGLPRVTAGVVEDGAVPGLYLATATLPDGYKGVIDWDTGEGAGSLHAYEVANPPGTVAALAQAAITFAAGAPLRQVFCTDEDIAARAFEDYPALVPSWQVQAKGDDGLFDAGYPWLLRSTTMDFKAAGVHARQVVHLTRPPSQFPAQGDLLAVEGVSTDGSSLQLRRIGTAPGIGQPPAPFAGLAGVTYAIRTFDTQIDKATDYWNRILGYDPQRPGQEPIYQPRSREEISVLTVLKRAYTIRVKGQDSDMAKRLALIEAEYDELRGHVVVKLGPTGQGAAAESPLNARVRR